MCVSFKDHRLELLGCVELNHLYECYRFAEEHDQPQLGLKAMYEAVLGKEMRFKSKKTTLSNWAVEGALTQKQVHYAADDALVCHELFEALVREQVVPPGHHQQQQQMGELISGVTYSWKLPKAKRQQL